jgi:mono/diheme cytochrome c family protein
MTTVLHSSSRAGCARSCTRWLIVLCIVALSPLAARLMTSAGPQAAAAATPRLATGKEIFDSGCVSCHGSDGRGQAQNLAAFERPATFPDFSDCPTATPEPDVQWRAIITHGGPVRGFSQIMPAFRDLLTQDQIGEVIDYLRSLCGERAWPRGNLNLPRPIVTEKAFPENETVVAGSINGHGTVATTAIYERRIGASAMIEAIVPYAFTHDSGTWGAAFGDLALGYKQKVFHSLKKGSIFSAGAELITPTGDSTLGTGGESTVFETYAAFGQFLPADSFLQVHTGIELPVHPDKSPRAYYLRTAVGKTFSTMSGLGRRWSPMLEVIVDRDLVREASTNWDVIPEIQIPISRRMHILATMGFRMPVNNTAGRPRQLLFYALWDWVDGGLTEGW